MSLCLNDRFVAPRKVGSHGTVLEYGRLTICLRYFSLSEDSTERPGHAALAFGESIFLSSRYTVLEYLNQGLGEISHLVYS